MMKTQHRSAVLNRVKTARGHLDAVVRMVEDETYCPEVMKLAGVVELSASRPGSLQRGY